jgi:hypothetical protein
MLYQLLKILALNCPATGRLKAGTFNYGAYYVGTSAAAEVPGWEGDDTIVDSGVESDRPGSTDGVWTGFLMSGDPSVYQTRDHVIAAGEEFLLILDARDNFSATTPALLEVTLYTKFMGQRVVLATETLEMLSSETEQPWATYSPAFAADTMEMLQGFPIGVKLRNAQESNSWIGIDNVRFVPEPATIALLGLGGLSLLQRRKA